LAFVTFPEPEEAGEVLSDSIYLLLQGFSTQLKTSMKQVIAQQKDW
jgi:hypothetical protein